MSHQRNDALDWSAMTMEDILGLAIADEEQARDYYRSAADHTGNAHTRAMLLKLSAMEQGHADELRKELHELLLQKELESGMAD